MLIFLLQRILNSTQKHQFVENGKKPHHYIVICWNNCSETPLFSNTLANHSRTSNPISISVTENLFVNSFVASISRHRVKIQTLGRVFPSSWREKKARAARQLEKEAKKGTERENFPSHNSKPSAEQLASWKIFQPL